MEKGKKNAGHNNILHFPCFQMAFFLQGRQKPSQSVSLYPVTPNILSGNLSPVTSDACKKNGQGLWKEKLCQYWCEKARKHTDA